MRVHVSERKCFSFQIDHVHRDVVLEALENLKRLADLFLEVVDDE